MSEALPPTRRSRRPVEDEGVPTPADAVVTSPDPDPREGRLATAQLEMAAFGDHVIPYVPPTPKPPPSLAPWALAVAILALISSFFWGWLLPLGLGAAALASISLRRPRDGRRVAVWALALAVLSVVFSAGWLIWGFSRLPAG